MNFARHTLGAAVALAAVLGTGGVLRAGCGARSGASQAKLTIHWLVVTTVAPDAAATGADSEPAGKAEWDRPMMIYIPSDDPTDAITRKLEGVVFKNEKVAIAAKFFETLKISRKHALDDRLLASHTDPTPQIVFLRRDYTEHAALHKKQISASKLLKAMKSLVREEYVNDFDTLIRAYAKLLDELDRLESRREALEQQRKRLEEQPNAARLRKLEREEAAHEAAMDAWMEKEEKLLELRRKGEKAPTGT
jgi:hypothetical protein